jgi:hypothetical protein
MATMNHTNLTTYNVPALTEFFCSVFGFQLIEKRGDKTICAAECRGLCADADVRQAHDSGAGVSRNVSRRLSSAYAGTLWTLCTMT